jgi:hypothetical protein
VIEAGGRLVSESIDHRSDSKHGGIYGSVFPLSQWIVENWWFLLNESYRFSAPYRSRDLARSANDRGWVQRHSLLAAREGGALPDLAIYRDGAFIVARWEPDIDSESMLSLLRFIGFGEARIDPTDAEQGLREFVTQVVDRLDGVEDLDAKALREEWTAVLQSMGSERDLCEWSARLGLHPYDSNELTDELAQILRDRVSALEASLRTDLLDAESSGSLVADLGWLAEAHTLAAEAGGSVIAEPKISGIESKTAHGLGYERARILRRYLGAEDGHDPIPDLEEILRRLGWAESPTATMTSQPEGLLGAVVDRSREGASVVITPPVNTPGGRFGIARSIFLRHFSGSGTERRLVTEAHSWDQRASRAFAAEFLAPASGLSSRIQGSGSLSQIDELAGEYDVSPLVIAHQIVNHRLPGWENLEA